MMKVIPDGHGEKMTRQSPNPNKVLSGQPKHRIFLWK